jgi:hypothetical protein
MKSSMCKDVKILCYSRLLKVLWWRKKTISAIFIQFSFTFIKQAYDWIWANIVFVCIFQSVEPPIQALECWLEIVESLHTLVLNATKEAILALSFLFIFVDEIITMDNQSCISIYCYVVVGWEKNNFVHTWAIWRSYYFISNLWSWLF